jgi:hypothetical protein
MVFQKGLNMILREAGAVVNIFTTLFITLVMVCSKYKNLLFNFLFIGLAPICCLCPLLFTTVAAQESPVLLFSNSNAVNEEAQKTDHIIRSRSVTLNNKLLATMNVANITGQNARKLSAGSRHIILNLFKDSRLDAYIEDIKTGPLGGVILLGHIVDEVDEPLSRVILVIKEGLLAAHITTSTGIYRIRPGGNGMHYVDEFDSSVVSDSGADTLPVPVLPDRAGGPAGAGPPGGCRW